MIVTRDFVFLHLHKSGGTFVNRFLLECFEDARMLGYHLPRAYLPPQYATLPVFGLVRNPWDYYVSWYSFQAGRPAPNPLFRIVSDDGRLGFAATLANLLRLGEDAPRLERVTAAMPEEFTNQGLNLTRACLRSLAGSPRGFYSWMFERMYGDRSGITIGRMETLRADLATFLARIGVPLDARRREFLQQHPALNVSAHPPRAALYDAASRDLVAVRDRALIEQFGYRFAESG